MHSRQHRCRQGDSLADASPRVMPMKREGEDFEMTEEEEDQILYEMVLETRAASGGHSEPWDLESED
jgi:hypothetical protein